MLRRVSIRRNLFTKRLIHSNVEKPFDKLLIANRGEIACRIMRTAKRMGIRTVAVYSDADSSGMHVRMADEAYRIGTAASSDSYLRMDRILEIAKKTGAQAIHPGYGFLSENATFVDKLESEGIAFVGPPSSAIDAMGDKVNSKRIALEAGCFTIPGFQGEVDTEELAVKYAKDIGYPVMIKASAGGGGKGMRVAYNDAELIDGFRVSKNEAKSSFGDDRMLIEKFIENPHHIEIQVVADNFGNVAAFPERECSVQRRNQKVVEESPSCLLLPETRLAMQKQAIALCHAVGYRSAGTVEMLADENQNFYFLEMNTRLQVEHPVTELVSGEDLVEHMLNVAANRPLPERLTLSPHRQAKGWAIESRVYAEDPLRNFLPSIGPLNTYIEPKDTFHNNTANPGEAIVRVDSGVYEGGNISMFYDPMISKLCTYADNRIDAINKMEEALDEYVIKGLGNNLTFLRAVMGNPRFRGGDYSTKFIGEEFKGGFKGIKLDETQRKRVIALGAAFHLARDEHRIMAEQQKRIANDYSDIDTEEDIFEGESNKFVVVLDGPKGEAFLVSTRLGEELAVTIQAMNEKRELIGEQSVVALRDLAWKNEEPLARAVFSDTESGEEVKTSVQYLGRSPDGFMLRFEGSDQEVIIRSEKEHELHQYMIVAPPRDDSALLRCPMPGTLVSCDVQIGQKIEQGQQLAIVEAMKMQNVLRAERSGVVKKVLRTAGQNLKVDEIIMEFE